MLRNIQFEELSSSFQVGRDINTAESQKAEETVKDLEQQIESLKLELHYQGHKLQESKQELRYANHELYTVYDLCEVISSKLVTIDEAKDLADSLLQARNLKMML